MKKLIYSVMAAMLILSSCAEDKEKGATTGGIYGSVVDQTTNEPIPAAEVMLTPGGRSTVTNSDGTYDFADVEARTYTLTVTKESYTEATRQVTVTGGDPVKSDVKLERLPSQLSVDPTTGIDFGSNASNTSQSFRLVNKDSKPMVWSIKYDDCAWISAVAPNSGTLTAAGTQQISITVDRTKLAKGNNEYHLAVSAVNSGGTSIKIIATNDRDIPALTTAEVSGIEGTVATFNGAITDAGNPPYTERGFVYTTTPLPTIANTIRKVTAAGTAVVSSFSANVIDLSPTQLYHVRAYAINAVDTVYGNDESFTAGIELTQVSTSAATNVDVSSATLNGAIAATGNPAYSERGFCYSTDESNDPTISNNKIEVPGSGTGNYSIDIPGLKKQTRYYVRAYAIQGANAVYGKTVNFITVWDATTVSTSDVTNISSVGATLNGIITNVGNPAYTERGFVYAKTDNPTIADNKQDVKGLSAGDYTLNLTELDYQTRYYVRAYVIQASEVIYGTTKNFITAWVPTTLTILAPTQITTTTAVCSGEITNVGDPSYEERGFWYSTTNTTPTGSNGTLKKASGNGESGTYTATLSNLSPGTRYYVRSYAVGPMGDFYYSPKPEPFTTTHSVTDIDGNQYDGIIVGDQVWMNKNLMVTKFNDGTAITNQLTTNNAVPGYMWYNNISSNKLVFGGLYNGYTVESSKNVCPSGWHVPSNSDWQTLLSHYGGDWATAGAALKANVFGDVSWKYPNRGATNASGLAFIGAGIWNGAFTLSSELGLYWSTAQITISETGKPGLVGYVLSYDAAFLANLPAAKSIGGSIRCVKD